MCFCRYFVSLSQVRYEHPYHKKHRISKEIRCFSNFLKQNEESENAAGVSFGVSCPKYKNRKLRNSLLAYTGSLYAEAMINTVQKKQQIMGLNYKLGSELINPNTIGNQQMEDEFRSIVAQIRRDIQIENPVSVPLTREFLAEMDKLLLEYADGKRENINPRIVAEVMTDKSMVANICTPDQRERFVTLMTEILSTYGGEGSGEEKEKT